MLLPAGWLLRDWKFSDKRTNKYRNATKCLLILWVVFGALSAYFYWDQINDNRNLQDQVRELINGKDELLIKSNKLGTQLEEYQDEIRKKDEQIWQLEKQAKTIRSIEGSIECLITANWSKSGHPARLVPLSWNKAQFYVRIFENDPSDKSTILFSLESINLEKISENDLKVKLEIKASLNSGPFGQDLGTLNKYGHILVHIPFIHREDTTDGKITLRNILATLIVNGDKKAKIEHADNFIIPMPESSQLPAFQLNRVGLLIDIYES
jgi:cell division protein FtsB